MLLNVSQRGLILLSITLHFSGLHVEINENIQEYTGIYRNIQEYTGIYRNIQEYTGVYRNIQGYIAHS